MNIKKEWVYKQKGLRNALISVDSLILNGKLIFAISYDKNGLFESQLIALDLHTREETVILKIPHVMRKVPIRSDGYLYVNAFDANMYCIDEQSFSVKWVEKFGKGNPNWGWR